MDTSRERGLREILGNEAVDVFLDPSTAFRPTNYSSPRRIFGVGQIVWAKYVAFWYPAVVVSRGNNTFLTTITIGGQWGQRNRMFGVEPTNRVVDDSLYHVYFCFHELRDYRQHKYLPASVIRTFEEGFNTPEIQRAIIEDEYLGRQAYLVSQIKLGYVEFHVNRYLADIQKGDRQFDRRFLPDLPYDFARTI